MAYTPQEWENFPSETTPLSASRMLHIESGIDSAHQDIDGRLSEANLEALVTSLTPDSLVIVNHGTDRSLPRPEAEQVMWLGSVLPQNLAVGDIFVQGSVPLPLTYSSLQAWYDPALAEVSGGKVVPLPDRSAHGRDLSPATGPSITTQPEFSATSLGGTPTVEIPAVSALTTGALATPIGTTPLTVGGTVQVDAGYASTQTIINQRETSNNVHSLGVFSTTVAGVLRWGFRRGGDIITSEAAVTNGPHTFVAVFNGASSRLYVDRVQVAAGNVGSASVTSLMLGSRNTGVSGAPSASAAMVDGKIGDLFVVGEAFSADAAGRAHDWLNKRMIA